MAISDQLAQEANTVEERVSREASIPQSHATVPAPRRPRRPLIIGGIAIVVVACAVVVVGFTQGWFLGEKYFVMSEQIRTMRTDDNQGTTTYRYERDEVGNLEREVISSSGDNGVVTYYTDEKGYVDSFIVSLVTSAEDNTWPWGNCSIENEVDGSDRLVKSVLRTQSGPTLTAVYSYFGNTDKLESITFSDYGGISSQGGGAGTDVLGAAGVLDSFVPDSFDPTHTAFARLASGKTSYTVRYSDEGVTQATIVDGMETPSSTTTLNALKNKTIEYGRDDESRSSITSCVWDENGCLVDQVTTPKDESYSGYSGSELHYSYTQIENPSKAVSIFNRLH